MKNSSTRIEDILQLVSGFYDAATLTSDWNEALGGLERLFTMSAAIFERYDVPSSTLLAYEGSGLPEEALEEWESHYHSICPRITYMQHQSAGTIGYDYKILEKEEIDQHPVYQDFFRKYDCGYYFLSVNLERDENHFTSLSVQRSIQQGHASESEEQLLKILTPHLQNALRVNHCLRNSRQQAAQLQASLHNLKPGVMIVDQNARLEFINQNAEIVVKNESEIRINRRVVSFRPSPLQKIFSRALSALRPSLTAPDKLTGFLPPNPSRPWPICINFLQIPDQTRLSSLTSKPGSTAARLLIIINTPDTEHVPLARLLKDCFQLTSAEAELAVALAEGIKLQYHAEQRSISITTVRTHLANLRMKMGARDQADVVRIVLQLNSVAQ